MGRKSGWRMGRGFQELLPGMLGAFFPPPETLAHQIDVLMQTDTFPPVPETPRKTQRGQARGELVSVAQPCLHKTLCTSVLIGEKKSQVRGRCFKKFSIFFCRV